MTPAELRIICYCFNDATRSGGVGRIAVLIGIAEAVRQTVAEGLSAPGEIADYAKARYGLDIPKPQVSAYKHKVRRRVERLMRSP